MLPVSDEVRVLHWHVEAFFDHWIVRVDIWSWSNNWLSSHLVVDWSAGLRAESLLACIEYNSSCLKWLSTSWLSHGLRASAVLRTCVSVQARPWYLELQALPIEDLVVIEAWRGSVETNSFTSRRFIIGSTCTLILPASCVVLNASDLILDSKDSFFIVDMLALLTLRHNLGPLSCIRLKNANPWVLCWVRLTKAIGCWFEDGVCHASFMVQRCLDTAHWNTRSASLNCEV